MELYMFWTVPLSIIRRIRLELHLHPDRAHKLSANMCDMYHCCVYSEKLLMVDRGTV